MFKTYLKTATADIRYVTGKGEQKNVSRIELHPIWETVNNVVERMTTQSGPPLLEARVLKIMREQRSDMALKQAEGNLINKLVLDGLSPDEIAGVFPEHAARAAQGYVADLGQALIHKKASEVAERLKFLTE